jgi:hypothetical protein
VLDDRTQERGFDACTACASEQVAYFGDDQCRNEYLPPCEMQAGEEIGTGSVVVVVAVGGCDERAGVADNHSGAPEAFGEQVVVVAAEIVPSTGEGREPRRRPDDRRLLLVLTAGLGEDGGDPLVRQIPTRRLSSSRSALMTPRVGSEVSMVITARRSRGPRNGPRTAVDRRHW